MGFNRNKGVDSYITKVLLQTKLYERRPRKFRRVSVKVGVSRFECLTPVFWKLNIWVKGLLLLGFYKDCRDHNWIIFGAMKHRYLSNKLHENFCKQHWRPWCCNVAKNPNSLSKNNFFSHVFLWVEVMEPPEWNQCYQWRCWSFAASYCFQIKHIWLMLSMKMFQSRLLNYVWLCFFLPVMKKNNTHFYFRKHFSRLFWNGPL